MLGLSTIDWHVFDQIFTWTCIIGPFLFAEYRYRSAGDVGRITFATLFNYSGDLWNAFTIITLLCFAVIMAAKPAFIKDFIEAQSVTVSLAALFVVRFLIFTFRIVV
jgi:hypothetical protein